VVSGRHPDVRAPGDDLSENRSTYVIFNPASGRGRGARRISTYRRLLEEWIPRAVIGTTTRPGEEGELAERAVAQGYDVVVAVGGDGTWSNVADRLVASGKDVALGMLPNGTGNDFGRNLGLHHANPREAVRALAAGRTRRVDVGRVDTPSASEHTPGRAESRHFLNVVGFGFDIAVIDAAARARFLKGEFLYKTTALQQLFRFPGLRAGVWAAGGEERAGRYLMLTLSNSRYFGGGFPIAPQARIDDGKLHACLIQDTSPLTRLRLFTLAGRGRHVTSDRVEVLDASSFRLTFDAPPRFEMDGDVRQSSENELEVRIVPDALTVVAPG
jgi:diacylglycerol kinase (ATP)